MTNWKEEFDELTQFMEVLPEHGPQPLIIAPKDRDNIRNFISTEVITKLIEEAEIAYSSNTKVKVVTEQLKANWLGKNNND